MSNEHKPQPEAERPHMEAQNLPEPMEEFVSDQSTPSRSMQEQGGGATDVKPAGHQQNRAQSHEPGVEE